MGSIFRTLGLACALAVLSAGCQALVWTDWNRAARPSPRRGQGVPKNLTGLKWSQKDGRKILPLTLDQSVQVALANNPGLRQALEEIEKAKGGLITAWAGVLPRASLGLTYHRIDEVSTFQVELPPAPPMDVKMGVRDNYKAELGLTLPLFQGGTAVNRIKLAGLTREYADLEIDRRARELAYGVRKAYIDVLLAEESQAVLTQSLENAKSHLQEVMQRLEQKVGTRFDVLRAEVKTATAESQLVEGRNRLVLAKALLLRLLGLPQDTGLKLVSLLRHVPSPRSEARSLEKAFKEREELAQADLACEMQQKKVNVARGGVLPKAYGYFNLGWEKPTSKAFGSTDGEDYWNAGIQIEVPIFDGLQAVGACRKEYAGLRQARWAREDLHQQIALEVRSAVSNLEEAERFLQAQRENVRQAEESLRLVKVGFSAGVNTQLDVLDVQTSLTATQLSRIRAVHRFMAASFALEKAEGSGNFLVPGR